MKRRNFFTMVGAASALGTVAATQREGSPRNTTNGDTANGELRRDSPVAPAAPGAGGGLEAWMAQPRLPVVATGLTSDPLVGHVLKSAETGTRVRFQYWGGSTPKKDREVTPGLIFKHGEGDESPIYLSGYCHERRAERTFRLDRAVFV